LQSARAVDIRLYREKVIKNCAELIDAAKFNFEKQNYPISAFLSITAIEEIAKIWYSLKFIHFQKETKPRKEDFESLIQITRKLDEEKSRQKLIEKCETAKEKILQMLGPYTVVDLDIKVLRRFLRSRLSRSHVIKQELGILSSLTVNSRAYRKLGPAIIKKYINMAKAGKLFDLRNSCLYIDVVRDNILTPSEAVLENEALELVCLAMEVVAEISDFCSAFLDEDYSVQAVERWQAFAQEADEFEKKYNVVPKKEVGNVANYLSRLGVAIMDLNDDVSINDEIIIESLKTSLRQKVTSIEINNKKVSSAGANSRIGMKVDKPVRKNDLVYKIIKNEQ
jgi:AbiV family abortive infection protein